MVVQSPCFRAPFGKVDVAGAAGAATRRRTPPHAAADAVHANLARRARHPAPPPHAAHATALRRRTAVTGRCGAA